MDINITAQRALCRHDTVDSRTSHTIGQMFKRVSRHIGRKRALKNEIEKDMLADARMTRFKACNPELLCPCTPRVTNQIQTN